MHKSMLKQDSCLDHTQMAQDALKQPGQLAATMCTAFDHDSQFWIIIHCADGTR